LPYEDVEVAMQNHELDASPGRSPSDPHRGLAKVTGHLPDQQHLGAWIDHLPTWTVGTSHLTRKSCQVLRLTVFAPPLHWYYGEAKLRVEGTEMKLTTTPDAEWKTEAAGSAFWDEIFAKESPTKANVDILEKRNGIHGEGGQPLPLLRPAQARDPASGQALALLVPRCVVPGVNGSRYDPADLCR
jgi:hypothetical protein